MLINSGDSVNFLSVRTKCGYARAGQNECAAREASRSWYGDTLTLSALLDNIIGV